MTLAFKGRHFFAGKWFDFSKANIIFKKKSMFLKDYSEILVIETCECGFLHLVILKLF